MQVGVLDVDQDQLRRFAQEWEVAELAVFGSVLRADFGAASDVDVMVSFADPRKWRHRDLLRMADELGRILGRGVDLIERDAVEENPNWIVRREILSTARALDVA